jgi:hypothetical protein
MQKSHIQLLFCLLILFGSAFKSDRATLLVGTITDDHKEPLMGVTVVAKHLSTSTFRGCITNSEGRFTLKNLRHGGLYSITLSYTGYKTLVKDSLLIVEGAPLELNFQMNAL